MLWTREQLLGNKCGDKNGSGVCKKIIADYKRIAVGAIVIDKGGLIGKHVVVPFDKVVEITDDQVKLSIADSASHKKQYADQDRYGELIKKPVYTKKEKYLGQVATYKINTETGRIQSIWVKTPIHLRALWKNILLISRDAVVVIKPEKIIVEDNIVKELSRQSGKQALGKIYNFGQAEPELTGNTPAYRVLNSKNKE